MAHIQTLILGIRRRKTCPAKGTHVRCSSRKLGSWPSPEIRGIPGRMVHRCRVIAVVRWKVRPSILGRQELRLANSSTQPLYDAFISSNKADKPFVDRLVKKIESEPFGNRRLKCFYWEWDIQPGEDILLKIEEALPKSRFVVVVMSPDWAQSNWTKLERVISVYEDPSGIIGRVIPILSRSCEIPLSLRILRWIDFSSDSAFANKAKMLVTRLKNESPRERRTMSPEKRTTPPQTFDTASAQVQEELLATNLFPVTQLPYLVFTARSRVSRRDEIWPLVGENADLPPFAFLEEEGRIVTFAPMVGNPTFNKIAESSDSKGIPTKMFLEGSQSRVLIDILNRSMTAHMKGLGMTYDWKSKSKKTFFPLKNPGDEVRHGYWRVGGRRWRRILAIKSKTGTYFAHRSCKATFLRMGGICYLRMVPGWHFTTDGIETPVDDFTMTSLSTRWMNMERNHSVIDDVRFWASTLSKDSGFIALDVGSPTKAMIASKPLSATVDHGIEGDYRERLWYEEPPEVDAATQVVGSEKEPTGSTTGGE